MNEFEDLLNSVSQVEPGDVVTAEVLTVDANQANVAISGTGVEGVLTLRELTNDRDADINDLVKPGETLELLVLRQVVGKDTDTVTYLVSKKRLEARKAWDKLVGRDHYVKLKKGSVAADFTMTDKNGKVVSLKDLRGKAVYIDCWATWCGPCCMEIPYMERLYEHYKNNKDIELISISLDTNKNKWLNKLKEDKPKWHQFIGE